MTSVISINSAPVATEARTGDGPHAGPFTGLDGSASPAGQPGGQAGRPGAT